jgi:transposase
MNQGTTLEDRTQIVELARSGLTDKQIAQRTGWSISTVRKWRRRDRDGGRQGLASAMGRPRQGALSTFPTSLRITLRRLRDDNPGWGPKTLWAELSSDPCWPKRTLPSISSIGRFLHEQGLTRSYERHHPLPTSPSPAVTEAHQRWELDARGYSQVPDVGVISLINLNDRFSHLRLLSYPCWLGTRRCERHPNTEDYQTALRLAFTDWGLPQSLQVDHEPIFINNKSKSPFPTRFHLWLIALGVDLVFGRPGQPRDQAMTERSHQLWEGQCLLGQNYVDWQQLLLNLRQRRDFLNRWLPCATLDHQPPLVAFPEAIHSTRPYRPEWEADLLDISRVYDYLALGRWFRLMAQSGTFSLGGQVYYLGLSWARQQVDITFDRDDQHLVCHDEAGQLIKRLSIKGLSVDTLMG